MMIGYILLYGMPALLAQGLLFVGFIYCFAFLSDFVESRFKKKKNGSPKTTTESYRGKTSQYDKRICSTQKVQIHYQDNIGCGEN